MSQRTFPSILALIAAAVAVASIASSGASAAGESGGLTLIEAPGARAAALGESISAAADDVTSFAYNPAALATITSPQVSLSYEKGIADDASGRVLFGRPNLGLSVGYYSAGNVDLPDGSSTRSVNAQTDLAVTLGAARQRGRLAFGGAVKYLSSQLAESDRASAVAIDLGIRSDISGRFRVGGALQNFGTALKFDSSGDPLPRIVRAGAEWVALTGRTPLSLFVETPYFLNEKELRPALGAETRVGPLAFRVGYRTGSDVEGLTLGTGIAVGGLVIDYSFGLVQDLNARQRISLGFRFGAPAAAPLAFVPAAISPLAQVPDAAVAVADPVGTFNGGHP
jgi:hypothetical protein